MSRSWLAIFRATAFVSLSLSFVPSAHAVTLVNYWTLSNRTVATGAGPLRFEVDFDQVDDSKQQKTRPTYNAHVDMPIKSFLAFPHGDRFLGFNGQDHALIFDDPFRSNSGALSSRLVLKGALSMVEGPDDDILVLTNAGTIVSVDCIGNVKTVVMGGWLPKGYMDFRQISRASKDIYVFGSDWSLVVADLTGISGQNKAAPLPVVHDIKDIIDRYSGHQTKLISLQGLVSTEKVSWIYAVTDTLGVGAGQKIYKINHRTGKVGADYSVKYAASVALLDVDTYTETLLARVGDDLYEFGTGARGTISNPQIFSHTNLTRYGIRASRAEDLLVDYPRTIPGGLNRSVGPLNTNRHTPAKASSGQSTFNFTPQASQVKNYDPLKDPRDYEDFVEYLPKHFKGLQQRFTVAEFYRYYFGSPTFKYYFSDLSDAEVKSLGFSRLNYTIDILPGREKQVIALVDLAQLLADAFARKACQKKLTEASEDLFERYRNDP